MNVDSLIINNQDLPFNPKDFAKSNVLQSIVLRGMKKLVKNNGVEIFLGISLFSI
jgi:hypothetical protein